MESRVANWRKKLDLALECYIMQIKNDMFTLKASQVSHSRVRNLPELFSAVKIFFTAHFPGKNLKFCMYRVEQAATLPEGTAATHEGEDESDSSDSNDDPKGQRHGHLNVDILAGGADIVEGTDVALGEAADDQHGQTANLQAKR
jgi:hypothetical protein